ncbi:MAG: hypothetical protein ACHQCI_08495, partial [Solirubrobacterales bacterium]
TVLAPDQLQAELQAQARAAEESLGVQHAPRQTVGWWLEKRLARILRSGRRTILGLLSRGQR